MAANCRASRVIERSSPHSPVVEQEAEWFNQIDRDAKTRCKSQQRPGILRDIRFKQSEPQIEYPVPCLYGFAARNSGVIMAPCIYLPRLLIYAAVCRIVPIHQAYSFPDAGRGHAPQRSDEVSYGRSGAIARFIRP